MVSYSSFFFSRALKIFVVMNIVKNKKTGQEAPAEE